MCVLSTLPPLLVIRIHDGQSSTLELGAVGCTCYLVRGRSSLAPFLSTALLALGRGSVGHSPPQMPVSQASMPQGRTCGRQGSPAPL